MVNLTTQARVKEHLGGMASAPAATLAIIDQLIVAASASFERYLRRRVLEAAFTEVIYAREGKRVYALNAYPVVSVTSLKFATQNVFTASTAIATTGYSVDLEGGFVRFQPYSAPFFGAGYLEVIGVGGMGTDTADFIVNFPDIAQAADEQIAYAYMRRTNPGGNITFTGGATQHTSEHDYLKGVMRTLEKHRRRGL